MMPEKQLIKFNRFNLSEIHKVTEVMNIVGKFTGLIFLLFFVYAPIRAQDYDVLDFGAKNDGISLNTNVIQHAIDYISENGGGRLIFNSGVFVSG